MTRDPVDFGGERGDDAREFAEGVVVDHERLKELLAASTASLLGLYESVKALSDAVERLRHRADANRSGGERQGSFGGEAAGEHGEDREVSVEPNSAESTDPERK